MSLGHSPTHDGEGQRMLELQTHAHDEMYRNWASAVEIFGDDGTCM